MATLSQLLDDICAYVHGGRNLALFEQYAAAVRQAHATGKTADRTAAETLGKQMRAVLPPSAASSALAVRTALRPDA
jgi:hypothetical protein